MSSHIIGLGGGGFTMETSPLLDLYVLAASTKHNPSICFLPTASGDNSGYIHHFNSVFGEMPCQTSYLSVVNPTIRNMEKLLLDSDIIYVGGGNSKSMLGLWREWGIDKVLTEAYKQGVILAGVSAGFVCWFNKCVTDSIPHTYTALDCLGLLPGTGCPHYNHGGRREAFHKLLNSGKVENGYAADDSVALHFIDGKFARAVSSDPEAKAYYVHKENDTITEDIIVPAYLGEEVNFNKYIMSIIDTEPMIQDNSLEDFLSQ